MGSIRERLMAGLDRIGADSADNHDVRLQKTLLVRTCIPIIGAGVVGFTPLSNELSPTEMVELLNDIFSHFDALAEQYNVEKNRTIRDSYMVAAGVTCARPDHAQALARMGLDMCRHIQLRPPYAGHTIDFRIGINSGPAVAGVIGRKKFQYDLWGDTVNTASRM